MKSWVRSTAARIPNLSTPAHSVPHQPTQPWPPAAHCRHPLYGGLIMVALGLAALTRSEVRLALSLALWAVLEQKARAEETALAARYGADYESYAQGTKKFVPFLY